MNIGINIGVVELVSIMMLFISFYALITGRTIIKSIIAIGLMETSVVMFLLSIGYQDGMRPPIGDALGNIAGTLPEALAMVADPLPQALTITAIVIGVAAAAINLTMLITLCREYRTTDWDTVKSMTME